MLCFGSSQAGSSIRLCLLAFTIFAIANTARPARSKRYKSKTTMEGSFGLIYNFILWVVSNFICLAHYSLGYAPDDVVNL